MSVTPNDPGGTALHFSQSNPIGPGMDDVAALLRRVAETLDTLGDVVVVDLLMHTEATGEGYCPSITVYYSRDQADLDTSRWHGNGQE